MCMAVYIASDLPLPLIAWNERTPAFHTAELCGSDVEPVPGQCSQPDVVYAGSYEGCGCGFFKFEHAEYAEPEELQACRESLSQLAAYVAELLRQDGSVELFACWVGDQAQRPELRGELTLTEITAGGLKWDSRQFFTVRRCNLTPRR